HVRLVVEKAADGEMHAVGGRAVDAVHALFLLDHVKRPVQRQRVARRAAVAIGRDDGDARRAAQFRCKATYSLGVEAVIVADEHVQAWSPGRSSENGGYYTGFPLPAQFAP